MVYVHTILRDVAGLFKVGRLVAYSQSARDQAKHKAGDINFKAVPLPDKSIYKSPTF